MSPSCIAGFSTGLLAAAAVALSPAVPALIPIAVEVVLVAFRLGVLIENTARDIENSPHLEEFSWAYVIPGKTEADMEAALDEFHRKTVSFVKHIPR